MDMLNNKQSWTKILLLLVIYKIVIEFYYLKRISPLFSYALLETHINWMGCAASWLLLVALWVAMPRDEDKTSTILFLLFMIITWIPLISYQWMNNQDLLYSIAEVACAGILAIMMRIRRPRFTIGRLSVPMSFFNLVFLVYCAINIYEVIKRGGIDLRTLDFIAAYDVRSEYSGLGSLDGYLVEWCAKAFFPFFCVIYVSQKKYIRVAVCVILQLSLYLSFGFKSHLVSIALVVLCLFTMNKKNKLENLIKYIVLANVIAYLLDISNITNLLRTVLPYRTLFIPAKNQYHYYQFFSENDHLFMTGTSIGRLLFGDYKYNKPIGFIVEAAFTNSGSNGNTGCFSYAYADFGFVGMVILVFILGIIFWLIDDLTDDIPMKYSVAAFSYWIITLNDNSIMISLLTGGFLWLFLLSIMYSKTFSAGGMLFDSERRLPN